MNPAIPTPPPTPPPPSAISPASADTATPASHIVPISNSENPADLILHLDSLLELYLSQLDTYTRLRTQLSKQLSNGFLSLAHANRTTTTGRRYGEEGYDGRMKAGRRLRITGPKDAVLGISNDNISEETDKQKGELSEESSEQADNVDEQKEEEVDLKDMVERFEVIDLFPSKQVHPRRKRGSSKEDGQISDSPESTQTISSAPARPAGSSPSRSNSVNHEKDRSESQRVETNEEKEEGRIKDPILQFGVLVPPSLRAAQNSFTNAVQEIIPELSSVERQMAWLEREVQRIRDKIDSKG